MRAVDPAVTQPALPRLGAGVRITPGRLSRRWPERAARGEGQSPPTDRPPSSFLDQLRAFGAAMLRDASDAIGPTVEPKDPDLAWAQAWLERHPQAAQFIANSPRLAAALNHEVDAAADPLAAQAQVRGMLNEAMVDRAGEVLAEGSPLTRDWLAEHPVAAGLIALRPGLAARLNDDPEAAARFMGGRRGAMDVLVETLEAGWAPAPTGRTGPPHAPAAQARPLGSFAELLDDHPRAVEHFTGDSRVAGSTLAARALGVLGPDSPLDEQWLTANTRASAFVVRHPALARYLVDHAGTHQAAAVLDAEA